MNQLDLFDKTMRILNFGNSQYNIFSSLYTYGADLFPVS